MTLTDETRIDHAVTIPEPFAPVAIDLYRDIHKGIRALLFDIVTTAGSLDPADDAGKAALVQQGSDVARVLVSHAEHEDTAVQPTLEQVLPELAERIAADHETIEARIAGLDVLLGEVVAATGDARRHALFRAYVELASFTAAYLEHQDVEERTVMPALEQAIGVEAVLGIHQAIIGAIPPAEMAESLAFMLPAMNIDDRADLLGGMREGAPAEVFAGVWGLAGTVLTSADHAALAGRLGLD